MADEPRSLRTRLSHAGRAGTKTHGYVNPPVARGSTVLWPDMRARIAGYTHKYEQMLTYGITGGETHFALEDMVAEIEGGTRCQLVSSGLAAVTAAMLAYAGAGDSVLVPDSVYGPTRSFCDEFLTRFGVRTEYYPPAIEADALSRLLRPETAFVYLESPGSHTFEMQDVPALAAAAHAGGAAVLMDNTWGFSVFDPFAHGVDVSIQALTKYAGGHSDVVLGAIVTRSDEAWERVRAASLLLGHAASPDDCWLTLRGLRTLGVRMDAQLASSLEVARWLAARPEVAQVLHPALPGAPGHAIWARDFTGGASLFGVEFTPEFSPAATHAMIDALQLFGIGASWGGYESLVLPTTGFVARSLGERVSEGPMIRLHVGLEDPADLIADLEHGLAALRDFADRARHASWVVKDDPSDIPDWRRLNERLTTSGQPTELQLGQIQALGVTHVVNLALHSHERALADEEASVTRLGMTYIHIPVRFENPTQEDFEQFSATMTSLPEASIHVHCIANLRVSAFLYRYRRDVLRADEGAAHADLLALWEPSGVWAKFIS